MRMKSGKHKEPADKVVKDIRRRNRRQHWADTVEKVSQCFGAVVLRQFIPLAVAQVQPNLAVDEATE